MADQTRRRTLEELKPRISESIEFLNTREDYSTVEVYQNLDRLHNCSRFGNNPCTDLDALGKYVADLGFGFLFPKLWKALSPYLDANEWESQGFMNLCTMLLTFGNLTNDSPELCGSLGKCGGISLLFVALERVKSFYEKDGEVDPPSLVRERMLIILHNSIRLCSNNRKIYRNSNAVTILQRCLGLDIVWKLLSLMILAYIVNDTESGLLASSEESMQVLIGLFVEAVKLDDHMVQVGMVFSAFELLDAINHVAINDQNKRVIENEGAIPAIVRMLQDDFSQEEQQVAAEALWNLAFIESIRQSDVLQEVVPTLEKLVKTDNKDLRGACASALWQIGGGVRGDDFAGTLPMLPTANTPQESPPSYQETITEPIRSTPNSFQIMVSYQWADQQRALEIRDRLVATGYKVWMDVTSLKGDILAAMADAVQKSDVILICMTEKYKDSKSCRSEATYAYRLEKRVIPLLLEPDYKPDGWLGLLLGMELYYEFYADDHLETNMVKLLEAVSECTSTGEDDIDGPIPVSYQEVQAASPSKERAHSNKLVHNWTEKDVQLWLWGNKLPELCEILESIEGKHLEKMYADYCKNEERFKDELRTDYEMKAKSRLKFIVALENLFKK